MLPTNIPPPGPVRLAGDAAARVAWRLFKKDTAPLRRAAAAAGVITWDLVPVRTAIASGWAVFVERPADHQAVLLGEDVGTVAVDLRPPPDSPAPAWTAAAGADGQRTAVPSDWSLLYRTIYRIEPYQPLLPGIHMRREGGEVNVTGDYTEIRGVLKQAGGSRQEFIARCDRDGRLTRWEIVAVGERECKAFRWSMGREVPARGNGPRPTLHRPFDQWLGQAALWLMRHDDVLAEVEHRHVRPTSADWDAYFDDREHAEATEGTYGHAPS